jgi:hypothetical protein
MSSGDWVLMGVAGWVIAAAGAWAVIRNNGQSMRLAGGASWMRPGFRRLNGIVLVIFGAALILWSILRWSW